MALIKNATLETGFIAQYWKITSVVINNDNKSACITVVLYKDETSRKRGRKPAQEPVKYHTEAGSVHLAAFLALGANPVAAGYAHLRTLPAFEGATNS